MKPTLRSALGFAVARVLRVAADSRLALRRTLRQTALLAVLCAFGAASLCHAIEAQTIAINFASDKATLGSGKVGFTKTLTEGGRTLNLGQELSSALWYASRDGSGSNITVKGALSTDTTEGTGRSVTLAFSANGTYNSFNNKTSGSLIGQLTHGYLDNGSSSQNSVTISNLPTTGYDVAIILSGDGYDGDNKKSAPNYTFSPIAVNDVNYTANEENGTYPGDACWGKRDSSTSLTEGVNVLFVRNVMTPTLTLRGHYLDTTTRKGRGTIAALMIFIHGTEGNEATQTVSATATAGSAVFSGAGLTWTNEDSETVTALGPNTAATLALPSATTLALDSSVDLRSLALTGEGSLTFSTISKGGLSATSTSVGADLDVSAKEFGASLGAVTVAADKTLTLGEDTMVSSVTHSSATSKVVFQGTRALTSVPTWALQTTGSVEFNRPISTSGDVAVGLGGSAAVTRRIVFKKDVQASRLVIGNGTNTVTDLTQEGGILNFSATSADMTTDNTTNPAIIFGHWPTTNVYNLNAGSLLATNGCAVLSWGNNNQGSNYTTTVNIGQSLDAAGETTAMMKVKGLTGHTRANNVATLTVYPSGTLSVGEWGLTNGSSPNKNIILAGGTLNAYATTSTTLTNGLKVTAPSKVTAATGTTLTIDKINFTTAEEVTIGSVSEAGSVVIQTVTGETGSFNVAAGSLKVTEADSLGTNAVTVAEGATLELAIAGGETQMANPISGVGTIEKRGSGVVTLMAAAANTLKVSVLEGTLNIGALRPATLSIADGAQVIVVPTEEEVAAGSLSLPVGITAAKVIIQNYSIASISETGVVTFTDINVWTNATGDGQWSTEGNWSMRALPGDTATVKVMVDAQTTLTLPESGATVARLRVSGTDAAHTLTLSGGALTVNGSIVLAGANLTAATATLPLANVTAIDLGEGTALDYTVTSAASLPALTGLGTFIKRGTTNMTFKSTSTPNYLAQVVVAEGILDTGEIQTASEFHITVEAGATFLTRSTTSLTSTASTLCLKGGAILDLRNGNGNAVRQFQTAITVDADADTPAIIRGSRNGDNSNLQGAITGKGTLEIQKAPDQTNANAFTISGNISDASTEERLALKVTQTGTGAAVTLTGNNTYTGGTTIADGAMVIVETISKLGPRGTVRVEDGGKLKLVNSSNLNETETNYGRVEGAGTVWYSSAGGNYYRILPSTAANRLPTSISIKNDLTEGLIISQQGTDSPETAVGSVSGGGNFRSDWSGGDNSRSLRIVQSKNTEHTGNFIKSNGSGRLTKVIVAGAAGATNKTLTLSGNTTTTARPLEIESSGSVKLTGSWNAAITINGALEVPVESGEKTISTVLAGTTGTLTKSGAGQLNLTGANTFEGNVAITGGTLNVGSTRGFTVSAIESGAKLVLSPTESERAAGQIALTMADGVTLSAAQLSVTGYPGVTGAGGYIYLANPYWKPTAEDAAWEHNWYRGTTAMATAPTSGKIEVNFSALTAETEVTIPSGTFDAVTFVGGEAEACSLVVTLGEEVSLGALTVSGRVTLPDTAIAAATEITAGATLSLAGSGATISTAITGAGSLCQRSGSTSLIGKNTYTGTTTVAAGATLSLAGERVLSDAFGDGSAVIVNGTLELANDTLELAAGSYCRRTKGEGIIRVLDEQIFAIGQAALPNGEEWSETKTTGLTDFTGTLALVGDFELRNAGPAEYTYAPKGFNVRFEDNGQGSSDGELVSASETNPVQVVLAAGCTLSGKGYVKCPIAFKADSVIEVTTATRLDLSAATITLPSGEGEHILLNAAVASNGFLYVAPSANVPASVFAFAEESNVKADTAAITVYRSSTEDTVQVITNPPVPPGTPNGVAAAIRDQANLNGMPVTVQEVTTDETKPKVKLEGALFFENVVKTEASYETFQVTATVTYDFGVSAITVKKLTLAGTEQLCVVVCAKVESAATSTAATFKKSAQVQLYLNDAPCNAATALTSTIDSDVDDGDKSVRWFAVPLSSLPTTGTSNFTVKVTESTP